MDKAAQVVVALYEDTDFETDELDDETKLKVLRLKAAACYAGYRLMHVIEMIRDTELVLSCLSDWEDESLTYDAAVYSLEEHAIRFASYLTAIGMFCTFKGVPTIPFLGLCPGLEDRLDMLAGWSDDIMPDKYQTLEEERELEKIYLTLAF